MINPKYVIFHDLIGFETFAKLKSKSKSTEFSYIGIIIDESNSMLIIEKKNKVKKYIKKDYIFRFKLKDSILEVDGLKIVGTPENRLRSLKKKKRMRR